MASGTSNGAISWQRRLLPFLSWTPHVNANTLNADFWAALTGALVVLPQGIAYATIAGMPPVYGLYAGMIPAIVAALFGSSWQLVSGPTVAGSLVMASALSAIAVPASDHYVVLALTLAFLVGVIELTMGLFRLGALVNFISHSVIVGFTAGAGVIIAANQLKNFLKLDGMPRGLAFYEVMEYVGTHLGDASWKTAVVGIITVVTAIGIKRYFPRWPYMIAAMVTRKRGRLSSSTDSPPAARWPRKMACWSSAMPARSGRLANCRRACRPCPRRASIFKPGPHSAR